MSNQAEMKPTTSSSTWTDPQRIESICKILLALVAVLGFLWGVFKYLDAREQEAHRLQEDRQKIAETRRIEATRSYLERQLKLYTDATQVAAQIATAEVSKSIEASISSGTNVLGTGAEIRDPRKRFWELYWGELALVEDLQVEGAMKKFGDALRADESAETLQSLSLSLAHACRNSLAKSWGVREWERPDYRRE